MTSQDNPPDGAAQLRQQAEATARRQAAQSPEPLEALSPAAARQTLHELRVHQIELEMQNEELRRTQVELQSAHERYFDLYDLAPVGYCTLSEQGLILESNLTAATLLGLPRGALARQPFSRFILPDDQDIYYRHKKQLTQAGEPQTFQLRLVRKDGAAFWAQLAAASPPDAAGAPVCRLVLSDITASKQAQAGLERMRSILSEAERIAHLGSWEWDAATGHTVWSDEEFRIYGLDPAPSSPSYEALMTKHFHPEDAATLDQVFREAILTASIFENDHRIIRPDGTVRVIHNRARPHFGANGKLLAYVGATLDITERRQAEDALRASLRDKEVMLKEIHHRVKNNLQVISSLVDLQANSLNDPVLRGLFREVRNRVRSMALVHEKLYQSENLAGVDFADYTRSLINFLSRAHGGSDTTVRFKLDLQPVSLPVERAVPCGLILNELVTNAFKHAFRGRAEGEVTTALSTGPDGRVSLRVSYNGVGLPTGMDWRQSPSLGLQLIHLLAGQLDATVEVRTEGGTEFEISFAVGKTQT